MSPPATRDAIVTPALLNRAAQRTANVPSVVAHQQQEMRSKCIERPQLVFEETTKDIHFCVKNPTTREDFCAEEIVYELVPVKKTRTVEVCVPRIEAYPVPVTTMKKLPKQIICCEKCCKHYK